MKNTNSHLATETVLHRGLFLIAAILCLIASGIGVLPAGAQAPGLSWTTAVGGRLFAVDAQANSYASQLSGAVVVVNPLGLPVQTNTICPLPGIARRDVAGNFYFAGSFDGTNDFGGITLVGGWINGINYNPPRWAPGYPTCFLAKYASNGSLLWAVPFGTQATVNHLSDLAISDDGSSVVGFSTPSIGDKLAKFSSLGTNVWTSTIPSSFGSFKAVKVSPFIGTNGCFLKYRYDHFITGGFYDSVGNLTFFTGFPQLNWTDSLATNGQPVAGTSFDAYIAGLASLQPILRKSKAGGSITWTQTLGSVEQWVLGGDSQGNVFLAGTNGVFSKYDADGIFIWSTNFGTPVVSMMVDSQDNRFLSFANGAIARLAADLAPVAPTIAITPELLTVFVGSNVTLTASSSGTPPLRYAWRQNGTNIPGATNAVLNLPSIVPSQAGLYTVVVTNLAGAVTSTPPALVRVKSVELYFGSQLLTNGTYTFASPPTLTVRSAFVGGSSFYTLDGSAPGFSGTFYSGPFTLTQSATIRAIGYSSDFFQSEEADAVIAIVLVNHTLSVSPSGGGTVNLNPPGGTYLSTNTVAATAVPATGYSFLYWLGDAGGTNQSVNISMERNKTIRAVFGTTLSSTVAGSGQIQLHPSGGVYPYGSVVRLTAIPDAGNYFGFWGNAATGNTNPVYFTVTAPTQTISSIFAATPGGQAALTILINGHGRVNPIPRANAYTLNQNISLNAVPDAGESFLNWSGDAGGTQNPLPVTMSTAKVITANFTSEPKLRVDRMGIEGVVPEGFRLTLTGDPGSVYQIVGSTNLTAWTSLGWITNLWGEVQFTDTNPPALPQRFYRAVP